MSKKKKVPKVLQSLPDDWFDTEYEDLPNIFLDDKDFDKKRYEANVELMQILTTLIVENPSQRFSQILLNYGFVVGNSSRLTSNWMDEFATEPQEVLWRVKETIKKIDGKR